MLVRILLLISFPVFTWGQGAFNNLGSGKSAGLNGINTTFNDLPAVVGNQAGMAWIEKFGVMAFAEQRFLLKELTGVTAGAVLPTKAGQFSTSLAYFGFESYSEQKIGLGYGRKLLKNLSIGGQLDFFNQQSNNFGSSSTLTFEAGLQMNVNRQLRIGFHTLNPIGAKLDNEEELTSNFKLGMVYFPIKNAGIHIEAEQDLEHSTAFRAGLTYRPIERLEARIGVRSNPRGFSFGVGYHLKNGFGIDVAAVQHEILGFTPSAGFIYQKL